MGIAQSKRREVKAYANKYTSSFIQQQTSSTTSSTNTSTSFDKHSRQQQYQSSIHSPTSTTSTPYSHYEKNKKNDHLVSSIYSNESRSNTPLSSSAIVSNNNSTMTMTTSYHKNNMVAPDTDDFEDSSPTSLQSVNQSNSFYLPKDWDLKEYQYNLHFALQTLYGGNVTPAVVPRLKKGSRVIQMGTCSGPWIMDMATQYPECHFTAVEVIPDSLQALPSLPNVNFVRDRPYHKGLDFPDNSIDYIHLRSMGLSIGLDKWPQLFQEARRILKPDGVIRIEEISHAPTGTVMIESFIETLRQILMEYNQDYDIAPKYGTMLQEYGFQVIEQKKRTVHYGSDGKISEDCVITILNGFEDLAGILAPRLGIDMEDYRHRIEMIVAQCVKINAAMEWYSWVGRRGPNNTLHTGLSSSSSTTTNASGGSTTPTKASDRTIPTYLP